MRKTITLTSTQVAVIPLLHTSVALTISGVSVHLIGSGTLTGALVGHTASTACTAGITHIALTNTSASTGWLTWATTAVNDTPELVRITITYEEVS